MNKPARIAVIGDSGVGKTSWIAKLERPDLDPDYISETIGCDQSYIVMHTCKGDFPFTLLDFAGDWICPFREKSLETVDGVIVLIDLHDETTFNRLSDWELETKHLCVPVILVGAKADLPPKVKYSKLARYCRKHHYDGLYTISTKANKGLQRPLLHLIRRSILGVKTYDYPLQRV